jgi:hypothetical protein
MSRTPATAHRWRKPILLGGNAAELLDPDMSGSGWSQYPDSESHVTNVGRHPIQWRQHDEGHWRPPKVAPPAGGEMSYFVGEPTGGARRASRPKQFTTTSVAAAAPFRRAAAVIGPNDDTTTRWAA